MSTDPGGIPPPPLEGDPGLAGARDAIVDALRQASARRDWNSPAIRDAVVRYAARTRTLGILPERMIVDLKSAIHDRAIPEVGDWFRSVITDRAVVWAIETYFRVPEEDVDEHGGRSPPSG